MITRPAGYVVRKEERVVCSEQTDEFKIEMLFVTLTDIEMVAADLPKLRGYLAGRYPWMTELHNHLPGGKFSYKFPVIHYRLQHKNPMLLGFGDGIEILLKVLGDLEKIRIGSTVYIYSNCKLEMKECRLGVSSRALDYRFVSPWMALKQENYRKYRTMDNKGQQVFLNHILRENLKTISKGTGYTIPHIDDILVEGDFSPKPVNFKSRKMIAFRGEFSVNFHVPEFFALGKQGARGFGVVRTCNEGDISP